MNVQGPDFQKAVRHSEGLAFEKFQRPGHWLMFPHRLAVASRSDGAPDFQIDLVRSLSSGVDGYGTLDFRVAPVIDLVALQAAMPGAMVEQGFFSGGWLRLLVREPSQEDSSTLVPPVRVVSNGLGVARLATQLSAEGVSLLKRALLDGTLLVETWAEMSVEGVAPRLPAVARLQASPLVEALRSKLEEGAISRTALVDALAKTSALFLQPNTADRALAAEAVADRLLHLHGKLVPARSLPPMELWELDLAAPGTSFHWDLAEPWPAARVMFLRFDPVGLVREQMLRGGLERLVVQRDLPEFPTGCVPVMITANLLDTRTPLLTCGVDLLAAPNPPFRVNAIRETIEFNPPEDRGEVILRFGAHEPAEFDVQTFAIVQTDSDVQEWRTAPRRHSGGSLRLGIDDFAARFIPVQASPRLLELGGVRVLARWGNVSQSILLSPDQPVDMLVCDRRAEKIDFECVLMKDARELRTVLDPAPQLFIEPSAFREYGAHQLQVEVNFENATGLLVFEFKGEAEDDARSVPLTFTPANFSRAWSWFAASPFAPGYRYRLFMSDRSRSWSEPQDPFAPLRLKAKDILQ